MPTIIPWTPNRIRHLRRRLNLTPAELAGVLGYADSTTIVSYETGFYHPSPDVCEQLNRLQTRADLAAG